MKAYILSLTGAALIAAAVTVLAPDGKGGGISKHIRLLTALALLCVITAPAVKFVGSLFSYDLPGLTEIADSADGYTAQERLFYESLSAMSCQSLENELKTLIMSRFNIREGDVTVRAEYATGEGTVEVNRIVVTLSGTAVFRSPYEIEEYIETLAGVDCDCVL